jgi:cell shape-determining protein MreC
MIRLLLHIAVLAAVAVFVALNVSYTTTINLFGYMLEDVSTVAVVLISLIAGVLYSFIYYVMSYIRKNGLRRAKKRAEKTKDRERELKEKEDLLKKSSSGSVPAIEDGSGQTDHGAPAADAPEAEPRGASGSGEKKGLFKRRKKG